MQRTIWKKAKKVVINSNSIQIRGKIVKKRFTDGHLSSFTRFGHDVKRKGGGTGKHAASIWLDNDSLRYIMLCQDCRRYLDSKRPGDTVVVPVV